MSIIGSAWSKIGLVAGAIISLLIVVWLGYSIIFIQYGFFLFLWIMALIVGVILIGIVGIILDSVINFVMNPFLKPGSALSSLGKDLSSGFGRFFGGIGEGAPRVWRGFMAPVREADARANALLRKGVGVVGKLVSSSQTQPAAPAITAGAGSVGGPYAHLPPYWQTLFQGFNQRPTQMQTHWNWPAFFFGAFWYLVKGMPASAALYFVLSIATAGLGWLFLAIYAGLYGPWDYYLKEVRVQALEAEEAWVRAHP